MNLLIVGAGAMGRWVAETVDADVAFADRDVDAAETAAEAVDGRVVALDTDERFDAVCLAVPMSAATDAIETYAPLAQEAVFDITGAMAGPISAMADHAPDLERVSFHPLFAPRNAPGNVALVVDESGPVTDAVREDMAAAGNHVFETTVDEHDEAMETVQAGAHTAVLAYALAAGDVREEFATPVSAGLEDLVATVTDGSPGVYSEIQSTFGGADDVAAAADRIAAADDETFEELYRELAARFGGSDETAESPASDESAAEEADR
ncbi:prephenate dehydrogenase [Halogranum gelatinilyticum]|uniref:Prephenate dehydrogenase n=1 Tax=Halogranum gelatinilyticum TaxID=660521 RepID=A0A1H0A1T0_9EURY|nr:prephenate dehydrogenase/arogenate dehydrogenase family protein [Halogranum gelatinilyticum]SDN26636.1 prephenate dehydrogenase [Halogranum gelatinilyticum]